MQEVCGRWGSKIPFFYFTFNQKQKCLRRIVPSFLFTVNRNHPNSIQFLDTMRHKLRGISAKCVLQIAAEQKWTPDRSSCRRVMPEPAAKTKKFAFGEMSQKCFKFPEERCEKTAGVVIAES